jgi:tetratricopeptide (TPR) repeat protein
MIIMENNEANDWIDKGDEAYNAENFEEAVRCFAEAAKLEPDNADAFFYWGNALANLAAVQNDESLFRESFVKYEKAVKLKPRDATAFFYWGTSLAALAKFKGEESLFREAFIKYKKGVKLQPNNADAFCEWGNALYDLAKLNDDDDSLFLKAFEKYEKAAQLDEIKDEIFVLWGIALFQLAKANSDVVLFKQSIEKFESAVQLGRDNDYVYLLWGLALGGLAKMKGDASLFREALEKLSIAIRLSPDYYNAFFNQGLALCYLGKITGDESLFTEAVESFKKSNRDILYIFNSLDNDVGEYILRKKILTPLLELDTEDVRFFREINKNINKNEIDKYKEVYLLSVYIISRLHVNAQKPNENIVAHYREKSISYKMLFDNAKLRLNAINYSNDPKEGETLLDFLYPQGASSAKGPLNTEYAAFAGCFSFNYDSLNQFRLYGKEGGREGTGLSLVFRKSFFSTAVKMPSEKLKAKNQDLEQEEEKHALFRCIYVDPDTGRVETVGHKDEYLFYREGKGDAVAAHKNYINDIVSTVREKMEILKDSVKDLDQAVIGQLLINLRYLTKHVAFKEEQECRIVRIHSLKDTRINVNENSRMLYVEYEPKVANHIKKIYFGPNANGMDLFQDNLTHYERTIPYERSKNPLA